MLNLIVRLFMVLAGMIASLFVAKDALNFDFIQTVIAMILVTIAVAIAAFWPAIKSLFKHKR